VVDSRDDPKIKKGCAFTLDSAVFFWAHSPAGRLWTGRFRFWLYHSTKLVQREQAAMTDISEFEQRISTALDRIGQGLSNLHTPAEPTGDEGNSAALSAELAAEKEAGAQLEERVAELNRKKEHFANVLETQKNDARELLAQKDADIQRLEMVNVQLRDNNRALRDANQTGVGEPELINAAMAAELESLRVSRNGDRAELDAILTELKPLVEGRADA
jgi:hypothetical protein